MALRKSRQSTGKKSYAAGLWAEKVAELLFIIKGYRILGRRIMTPSGEIDLLAAKHKTLVIIEVKKRADEMAASCAITPFQQQRLIGAAGHMLQRYQGFESLRFDAVLFVPKRLPKHIKNAFYKD